MRENLVRNDMLECIIGLGPNLFYNSPMEACIVICRMNKRPERRGKILFINAIKEVERKSAQSFLEERHILKITKAYDEYETDGDFARVVTIQDIEDNNFSLSIPLYVKHPGQENDVDERSLQERYEDWRTASEIMKLRYMKLNNMLVNEVEGDE